MVTAPQIALLKTDLLSVGASGGVGCRNCLGSKACRANDHQQG